MATLSLNCVASGARVAYELISGPAHGSLGAIDPATGAVTYTPSTGYTGPDQVVFDATDATGVSAPATLSLTVVSQPQSASSPTSPVGVPAPGGSQAANGSQVPAVGSQGPGASQAPPASGGSARAGLRSVICRSGSRVGLICSVTFLSGGWIAGGTNRLTYSLSRNGRTVLAGRATAHHGAFRLQSAKGIRPGRYILSVIVNHKHQRIVLSRAITVR